MDTPKVAGAVGKPGVAAQVTGQTAAQLSTARLPRDSRQWEACTAHQWVPSNSSGGGADHTASLPVTCRTKTLTTGRKQKPSSKTYRKHTRQVVRGTWDCRTWGGRKISDTRALGASPTAPPSCLRMQGSTRGTEIVKDKTVSSQMCSSGWLCMWQLWGGWLCSWQLQGDAACYPAPVSAWAKHAQFRDIHAAGALAGACASHRQHSNL